MLLKNEKIFISNYNIVWFHPTPQTLIALLAWLICNICLDLSFNLIFRDETFSDSSRCFCIFHLRIRALVLCQNSRWTQDWMPKKKEKREWAALYRTTSIFWCHRTHLQRMVHFWTGNQISCEYILYCNTYFVKRFFVVLSRYIIFLAGLILILFWSFVCSIIWLWVDPFNDYIGVEKMDILSFTDPIERRRSINGIISEKLSTEFKWS